MRRPKRLPTVLLPVLISGSFHLSCFSLSNQRWWNVRGAGLGKDCIEKRIYNAYNANMKTDTVPMLATWDKYKSSLPVREGALGAAKLFQRPFFSRVEDLDARVDRLEKMDEAKDRVAYLAAPSGWGKSAAVLPMFLRSVERNNEGHFTHYIYMAFANNNRACHSSADKAAKLSSWGFGGAEKRLEQAGASFMLHCFKVWRNGDYHRGEWLPPLCLPSEEETAEEFEAQVQFLMVHLGTGRLLLHLDEHRSMCKWSAAFRRGALRLAGSIPWLVRVIATYTDLPSLPGAGSSQVCRYPIAMTTFDVRVAFPELVSTLQKDSMNGKERRLLASFWVKLGLAAQQAGLWYLHGPERGPNPLKDLVGKAKARLDDPTKDTGERLMAAMRSFAIPSRHEVRDIPGTIDLFLGVPEKDASEGRYPGTVSMSSKLTLPLFDLMYFRDRSDPASSVFAAGQDLFCAGAYASTTDVCDGALLERAYVWALASRFAKAPDGELVLGSDWTGAFKFQCKNLKDGLKQENGKDARVFTKSGTPSTQGLQNVENSTIYHATSEGGGAGTHKGFDIWFRTADDELALLDVTGASNAETCKMKMLAISKAVQQVSESLAGDATVEKLKPRGVLLAPNCCEELIAQQHGVEVVWGMAAQELLGGLQQLLAWLDTKQD